MAGEAATPRELIDELVRIVGRRHVLSGPAARQFTTGYRFGGGDALVVRPGSLLEMWWVLEACVDEDQIVILQAANTGLTGGSTPEGAYDRSVVVINTQRLGAIHLLRSGEQVVCTAGASLFELERVLRPLGREPHSVIGSSCIGASVIGGVCNNSGGALVRRGPAYTEYALYAQLDADGHLRLHNHLGIELGENPESILAALDAGRIQDADICCDGRAASAARDYADIVRAIEAPTPARFNADPRRLFEASGSAGKLAVFAVRLETFSAASSSAVFYVGSNAPAELSALRRELLASSPCLPVSGEYIHREAFDFADRYGKDTVLSIEALGADRLPQLFAAKSWIDRMVSNALGQSRFSDRLLQAIGRLLPDHLPPRLRCFRERFEHHLILKVADEGVAYTRALLGRRFPSETGAMFECTDREAELAMLHRFAVAGAAVRYRAIHADAVEDIVALDIALPRNANDWAAPLPPELDSEMVGRLYYGHFLCHVFHQDYLVRKGSNPARVKARLLALLDARGAEYPAEHNVGHLYKAKPALADHYQALDVHNAFNPGIGRTSRRKDWA